MAQVDFLRALLAGGKGHLQGEEFARQLQAQYQQQEYDNQLKAQDMQRLQQLAASSVGLQGAQTEGMLSATGRAEAQFGIEQPVMEAQAGFDINKIDMEDRLLGPTETARRTGLEAAVPQAQLQGAVAQTGLELQPMVEEAAGMTLEQRVGLLTKLKALGYTDQQAAAMVQDEVTREQVGKTVEAKTKEEKSIVELRAAAGLPAKEVDLAGKVIDLQAAKVSRTRENLGYTLSNKDWARVVQYAEVSDKDYDTIVTEAGEPIAKAVVQYKEIGRMWERGLKTPVNITLPSGQVMTMRTEGDIAAARAAVEAADAELAMGWAKLGIEGERTDIQREDVRGRLDIARRELKLNTTIANESVANKILEGLTPETIVGNPDKAVTIIEQLMLKGYIDLSRGNRMIDEIGNRSYGPEIAGYMKAYTEATARPLAVEQAPEGVSPWFEPE